MEKRKQLVASLIASGVGLAGEYVNNLTSKPHIERALAAAGFAKFAREIDNNTNRVRLADADQTLLRFIKRPAANVAA